MLPREDDLPLGLSSLAEGGSSKVQLDICMIRVIPGPLLGLAGPSWGGRGGYSA